MVEKVNYEKIKKEKDTKVIGCRINNDIYNDIVSYCTINNIKINDFVKFVINDYFSCLSYVTGKPRENTRYHKLPQTSQLDTLIDEFHEKVCYILDNEPKEQIKVKSKQELIDTDPNRAVKCQKCQNMTKKQIYLVNNKFICIDCYLNSKLKKGKNKKCSQKKQQ
jgi:hypothetical protein